MMTGFTESEQPHIKSRASGGLERYYTQPGLWEMERYEGSADQRLRAQGVVDMVDAQVESILDVGCGNGFVTRCFRARKRVIGLDPSQEALRRFEGVCVLGNGAHLPFPDRSFDVVVCVEVLEHLSDDLLVRTVHELARVARQQLVIGIPYSQDLRDGMTQCRNCGTRYHVDLHQRSFSKPGDVVSLVPGFSDERCVLLGKRVEIRSQFFKTLRYALGGPWAVSSFARCPTCGFRNAGDYPRRRLRRWLLNRLAWRMPTKQVPSWMILLLKRDEAKK